MSSFEKEMIVALAEPADVVICTANVAGLLDDLGIPHEKRFELGSTSARSRLPS